ncbi:fatty acid-binding protein isoform X1 [Andrena cerasifolii]|uniref:fatty acid-binding protein isoform X1 n=1 Tax=Andrena cerasifolii TaxID=2819439 RepID=UPI004037A806
MTSLVGNYQHERNDNLDEYFKAVGMFKSATKNDCGVPYDGSKNKYALTACVTGVPYIPRKMMSMSHPQLQISNDGDKWTIRTISMIRTVELTFTLGEEYEEYMPAGVTLKNVTTMEGDSLVTVSVGPDNNKVVRKYETTEDGVLLTMTHEKSGQVAKRYFTRLS